MRRSFFLLVLLLAAAAPAQAQLPSTVQQAAREAEAECRSAGGRPRLMPAFRAELDLNGDGRADYVHDYTALDCQGAASFFCGSAGCPIVVFLSPGYQPEPLGHSQSWTVDRTGALPAIVLSLHGSSCGRVGSDTCEQRLAWNGRELAPVGAAPAAPRLATPAPAAPPAPSAGGTKAGVAAPAPRVAPPPMTSPGPPDGTKTGSAARPGGWEVRRAANGQAVAVVAGPGVVSALTVLCHQGVPVVALAVRARPPGNAMTLALAGRSGHAALPMASGGGNTWYGDLRGSPMARLLAGGDSAVDLLINGGRQGRVSLQGSTSAVREALAACLPM